MGVKIRKTPAQEEKKSVTNEDACILPHEEVSTTLCMMVFSLIDNLEKCPTFVIQAVMERTIHNVTGDKPMSDFEEQSINALRNLFEKVDTLRQINIRNILKPEIYQLYEDTLQAAYDSMTTVEDALTAVGMKLEYEHFRLGGAVDELRPLMIQPRSNTDRFMEAMNERMRHLDIQFDRE